MKPWEEWFTEFWNLNIRRRKLLAFIIILFLLIIPALTGIIKFYSDTFSILKNNLFPNKTTTTLKDGEETALNEWVAAIAYFDDKSEADRKKEEFKSLYIRYEDVKRSDNSEEYALWRDDIFVVRHPSLQGKWVLIIDMYYGTSSSPAVSTELARISKLGQGNPSAQNTYQRAFINSHALCYSQKDFELTYGEIIPKPNPKQDPPCEANL